MEAGGFKKEEVAAPLSFGVLNRLVAGPEAALVYGAPVAAARGCVAADGGVGVVAAYENRPGLLSPPAAAAPPKPENKDDPMGGAPDEATG